MSHRILDDLELLTAHRRLLEKLEQRIYTDVLLEGFEQAEGEDEEKVLRPVVFRRRDS
jgi:hypothetical protein